MLRIYLLQIWFNLSVAGVEDAIYDSYWMTESVREATTLLKFRHLLEEHDIGKTIFDDIKKASGMYFSGNKEPMLKSATLKSEENVQYVLDFEEVVNGAHWELGDFERLQKARKQKREQDMQAVPIMVKDLQVIKEKK